MADKMKPQDKPLTTSEQEYEKKLEESALSEMRDKKMREKMEEGYYKSREQSLGPAKKMRKGGMVKSSASRRADGCAVRGKTKGRVL